MGMFDNGPTSWRSGPSSGSATPSYMGKALINGYVNYIQEQKDSIRKNYEDMDLENSEVNTKFEEIVSSMEKKCEEVKSKISEYTLE